MTGSGPGPTREAPTGGGRTVGARPPAGPDDVVEVEVEAVATGGDGVARGPGGRVVFVPLTAPGDRIEALIREDRGSYARARLRRLLSPGPGRREPPCPHYGRCGGCQLQHLTAPAQRAAKRRVVRDALERIGGLEVEVPLVEAPGPELGYRNRVTFTLRRGAGGVRAGYHHRGDPDRLVDVERCPLAEEPVNRAWGALRRAWGEKAGRLPSGREIRVTVRASAAGEVALLVRGGDGPGDPESLAGHVEGLSGYFWRPRRGGRRRLAGASRLRESWLGLELELRPEVFLQVNRAVAAAMEGRLDRWVRSRLGGIRGRRLLDLYAGVGARAVRWARLGAEAAACEVDPEAVEVGREAAARHGVELELCAGPVEERARELLPAELVVVNPPRAGLSRESAGLLAEAEAGAMAYVSCDPATLARDLKRLAPRWRAVAVQPFDAFPQTAHVETVVWLERS